MSFEGESYNKRETGIPIFKTSEGKDPREPYEYDPYNKRILDKQGKPIE